MKKKVISLVLASLMLASLGSFSAAADQNNAVWTSVWSTSMVKSTIGDVVAEGKGSLVGSLVSMSGNTVRVAITPQGSGSKVRLVLANDFGTSSLSIKSVTVGKTVASNTRNVVSKTFKTVTYNGAKSFSIPAGQRITTDGVDYAVTAGEKLTVSIYYGSAEPNTIGLYGGDSYTHIIGDDYTNRESFGNTALSRGEQLYSDDSSATGHYDLIPTLCEIDTYGTALTGCCVVFGDSTVTNEVTNYLAQDLRGLGITDISVTQAAIKGNRLVADGAGSQANLLGLSALKRFEKDVLAQANVKYVIVKIGVNDVIHPNIKGMNAPATDYYEMQEAFRTLSRICRRNGIMLFVSEIFPWQGYTRDGDIKWTKEIDSLRVDLNAYIVNELCSYGTLYTDDFASGSALLKSETTDGAHPNDAGQRKMAEAMSMWFIDE